MELTTLHEPTAGFLKRHKWLIMVDGANHEHTGSGFDVSMSEINHRQSAEIAQLWQHVCSRDRGGPPTAAASGCNELLGITFRQIALPQGSDYVRLLDAPIAIAIKLIEKLLSCTMCSIVS